LDLAIERHEGSWRWMTTMAGLLCLAIALSLQVAAGGVSSPELFGSPADSASAASTPPSTLERLASEHPGRKVEVIAQLAPGTGPAAVHGLIRALGGSTIAKLPIINGVAVEISAGSAQTLGRNPAVESVSFNAPVRGESHGWDSNGGSNVDPSDIVTAYNRSIRSPSVWDEGYTGDGVGVALVDTGIAGDLPDFRVSARNATSRVIASAVVNPDAATAGDGYGHGTHVAGLIAGNGANRAKSDPLDGKYVGVAPDADLISVKVADEDGNATVLDVIEGLQFTVDHRADYNIRVVNLSLKSTEPASYLTDPLDAAVEAAWNNGIVVVAAAGNTGTAPDAVSYAPANDPYVITVGGVDDAGTKTNVDDRLASWSSRGTTQDGFAKPDILAPGAGLVSTIAPGSDYLGLCPTCVTDGQYFRVGGTSMAAGVVSGQVALMLDAHPRWSPNQVKAQIVKRSRPVYAPVGTTGHALVNSAGEPVGSGATVDSTIVGGEAAADMATFKSVANPANAGLTPSTLIDPATGGIDYSRASWSRASWSEAVDPLRASWSRASWSRASWSRASWSATEQSCTDLERASWSRASWSAEDLASAQIECSALLAAIYPTRASWSATQWSCTDLERASWSRASWSAAENESARDECMTLLAQVDPTRASWSRASWSRASWSRASWSRASWSTSFDK
jgi:serine protease AprX